jgi:hypothetical protein
MLGPQFCKIFLPGRKHKSIIRVTFRWCYGLDKSPPKAHVLKAWSSAVVLLGGGRPCRRWGLVEGSYVIGGMVLKRVLWPHPSCHSVCFCCQEVSRPHPQCAPSRISHDSTGPKQQGHMTMDWNCYRCEPNWTFPLLEVISWDTL